MTARTVPSTASILATLIRVTLLRLIRGRAVWVCLGIAFLPLIHAGAFPALIEPCLGACRLLGWWQMEQSQEIARDEMDALLLEIGLALGIDEA